MANLVMGLSSSPTISSVVELTRSSAYHYSYSNITKVLDFWECTAKDLLAHVLRHIPSPRFLSNGQPYYGFIHDFVPLPKPASATLRDRSFLLGNNPVAGKLSLTGGYHLSCFYFSSGLSGQTPPLLMERMEGTSDKLSTAIEQVQRVLCADLFQHDGPLNIVRTDSYYGCAAFLAPLYEDDNLLVISRLRASMKVWSAYAGEQIGKRKREYDERYYLKETTETKTGNHPKTKELYTYTQRSIHELPPSETSQTHAVLGNGRRVNIHTTRWCDMLFRSKGTAKMSNKPMDIVEVKVLDADTNTYVFKRPM